MFHHLKTWCYISLPYVPTRCNNATYALSFLMPPLTSNEKCFKDLEKIVSPVGCYLKITKLKIDKEVLEFYHDCGGCIHWYLCEENVYWSINKKDFFFCANNLTEFIARIEIENEIWYKIIFQSNINHKNLCNEKMLIELLKTEIFTQNQKEYLCFFQNISTFYCDLIRQNNTITFTLNKENQYLKNRLEWKRVTKNVYENKEFNIQLYKKTNYFYKINNMNIVINSKRKTQNSFLLL